MGRLLEVVIPLLTLLVGYQGGLTRTSRLSSVIRSNLDLLDKLPSDSPSRVKLSAQNDELVDTLIRRQRRRFEPIAKAGWASGANSVAAVVMMLAVVFAGLEVTGLWRPDPEPRPLGENLFNLALYAALALWFGFFAVRAWWKQRREQPQPGQA
jgi:hypothetical protein